jgi:phosphoribosylaminoimidazole-succinocarboxamide synthase
MPAPAGGVYRPGLPVRGWAEYRQTGAIGGLSLPAGLVESQKLPGPVFTPSTKAELGTHDENISFDTMGARIGAELAAQVRDLSLAIYRRAQQWAEPRGIIIADTKFEFGLADGSDNKLLLIDEVLTPDSSRFWPQDDYKPGGPQKSYDKQYLRDFLESLGWNKQPPPPPLPADVIANTRARYIQALKTLTGEEL